MRGIDGHGAGTEWFRRAIVLVDAHVAPRAEVEAQLLRPAAAGAQHLASRKRRGEGRGVDEGEDVVPGKIAALRVAMTPQDPAAQVLRDPVGPAEKTFASLGQRIPGRRRLGGDEACRKSRVGRTRLLGRLRRRLCPASLVQGPRPLERIALVQLQQRCLRRFPGGAERSDRFFARAGKAVLHLRAPVPRPFEGKVALDDDGGERSVESGIAGKAHRRAPREVP